MKYAVSGAQMEQIDRDTIRRIGIPSMVLMERAALSVVEAVEKLAQEVRNSKTDVKVLVACGTGNNGADGIAVGRILHGRGYSVTVLLAGGSGHGTEENLAQQRIADCLGVPMAEFGNIVSDSPDIIVDAVFGAGLSRAVEGEYRELLAQLAQKSLLCSSKVVAVDLPSGIHSGTGAVLGTALSADVTITFGYVKTGLCLNPGKSSAGAVCVADIGFSDISLRNVGWDAVLLEPMDLNMLPERRGDGNKGTFGKALVIAGSCGMSGAAYLSALGAYRAGAGLVKVLTVPENRMILQSQLPEAIVEIYEPDQFLAENEQAGAENLVKEQCGWADVIVLGPGLGRAPYVERLVEAVLSNAYVPIVLDADGLNCVAEHSYLTGYFTENIIVTPHMGEMARLTGCDVKELKADPLQSARRYSARCGVTCVMKDAVTVTADKDGKAWINGSGCSSMAKAGSGDVLTGVIAGLVARGMECAQAAAFGAYIHGLAGERAAAECGVNGVLARDIADRLLAD